MNHRQPIDRTLPAIYQIEAFSRCNLRCPFCPTGVAHEPPSYPHSAMDMELFETIVQRDLGGTRFVELQFRGEPTLHKELHAMTTMLRDRVYVGFSTHGGTLHRPPNLAAALNVHYLTISIDAGSESVYRKKRVGGNWSQLLTNIDILVKVRGSQYFPRIDLQLIEEDYEERTWQKEFELLHQLVEDWGWKDIAIRSIPNSNLIASKSPPPTGPKDLCLNPWLSVSIKANGDVVPCCMAFEPNPWMVYGNVGLDSLRDIWAGNRVREFRASHARAFDGYTQWLTPLCARCTNRSPCLFHDQLLFDAVKK